MIQDLFYVIILILGLTLGNFGYQALTKRYWDKALEVSLFQLIAILGTWWILS